MKNLALGFTILLLSTAGFAQEGITTLGIQFKPMFPSSFFGSGAYNQSTSGLDVIINPQRGYSVGMVMRRGVTKNWSFETGINFVQRNYRFDFNYTPFNDNQSVNGRFVGYEIPLQALLYVRLGNNWWMNASGGVSLDMYPTSTLSQVDVYKDSLSYNFAQKTYRRRWIQVAVMANYGFEYRTKKDGYFYVGASYHRPFNSIGVTDAFVSTKQEAKGVRFDLIGTYLTLDLRYFFHEDPERRIKKSKKAKKPD